MRTLATMLLVASTLRGGNPFLGIWDLDIANYRSSYSETAKRVEASFTKQDGGLLYSEVQYRVDGRVVKRTHLLQFDQTEHPNPNIPGGKQLCGASTRILLNV